MAVLGPIGQPLSRKAAQACTAQTRTSTLRTSITVANGRQAASIMSGSQSRRTNAGVHHGACAPAASSAAAPSRHVATAVAAIACRMVTSVVLTGMPFTVRWYAMRPMLPACMGM